VISKKDKILAAAQKFVERGQLDKALAEFAKVVQEDPKDTRTWLKMAELHAKRGAAGDATEIYLKTGEQYSEQGFFQKAVAVYKNVLKLSPGLVQGHAKLADAYKRLGLMSDAWSQFDLAAAAYQKAGKMPEALAALRQMVEISPENVVARIKLAEAASQAGDNIEAVRELGKAAEKLKAQGRTDEFVRVAERLLFFQAENFEVARELADVYISKNNGRQALARLQGALKADPRDPRNVTLMARAFEQIEAPKAAKVWKELAQLHDEGGRSGERDAAIRKAAALAPGDSETQELIKRWNTRSGPVMTTGGMAGLAPLRSLGAPPPASGAPPLPEGADGGRRSLPTPLGLTSQARFKMDIGAAATAGGAAGAPPPNPDVSRIMAETEVFVKYGLLDRAVDHLRRVFEIQPNDQPAREKLSAVLAQLGRKADAADELLHLAAHLLPTDRAAALKLAGRALELDPASEKARALLGAPGGGPSPAAPSAITSQESARSGRLEIASSDALEASDDDIVDEDRLGETDEVEIEVDPYAGGPEVLAFEDDPLSEVNIARNSREDDLLSEMEQVDFFMEQAMPDEAGALLTDLQNRFGRHDAIDRKLHQVRQMVQAQSSAGAIPGAPATVIDKVGSGGRRGGAPVARMADGQAVDVASHGDLGIAYKEMGLWDPAIAEFKQLARDPRRQVFALTMIGECLEAKAAFTDAVMRYKEALNCPQATATESTLLYYLLGGAFERMNDRQEALYFYEKVSRRDAKFRDIESKLVTLKPRTARQA
jgi:tetratricopeptide (TPR) repeat protein